MRIFSVNRGVKGSRTLQEYAIRFAYMISEEAKRRATVLTFWQTHGLAATIDAHGVKRRTLFSWKRKLTEGRGKLESLNPGSRRPKVVRKRLWSAAVIEEIKRLRYDHPNLGKKKLTPHARP
jgi:transposase-like protein